MKEITIKLDDEWFNRLNEARKLESPNVRNATLCRRMVETMIEAIEDFHREKEEKKTKRKRKKA